MKSIIEKLAAFKINNRILITRILSDAYTGDCSPSTVGYTRENSSTME